MDCLENFSGTLTHLVWGLTHESFRLTDIFLTQYNQEYPDNVRVNLSNVRSNKILITRMRKPKLGLQELGIPDSDIDRSNIVELISAPDLQTHLEMMSVSEKVKVIKIPFSEITTVYLEHFEDL